MGHGLCARVGIVGGEEMGLTGASSWMSESEGEERMVESVRTKISPSSARYSSL